MFIILQLLSGIALKSKPQYKFKKKARALHTNDGIEPDRITIKRIGRKDGPLTGRQKRVMNLHTLARGNKNYEQLLTCHEMWLQYSKELLGLEYLRSRGWAADPLDSVTETVQNKVKKIEYYGAMVEVTSAKCPSLVGLKGIIIEETKRTFSIVLTNNKMKVLPKLHMVFKFVIVGISFTVMGAQIMQRPVERARQNFKKAVLRPFG